MKKCILTILIVGFTPLEATASNWYLAREFRTPIPWERISERRVDFVSGGLNCWVSEPLYSRKPDVMNKGSYVVDQHRELGCMTPDGYEVFATAHVPVAANHGASTTAVLRIRKDGEIIAPWLTWSETPLRTIDSGAAGTNGPDGNARAKNTKRPNP